jgi:hypothetical protein
MPPLPIRAALAAALLVAATAGGAVATFSPPPAADARRGSEDAFASGLHRRELPPRQAPIRWTTDRASFRFRHLPRGPAHLEVAVAGHRGRVIVVSDGVVVGTIATGETAGRFVLPDTGRRARDVQLDLPTFVAGDGRQLGARLGRVAVVPARRGPAPGIIVVFVAIALAAFGAARFAGLGPGASLAASAVVTACATGLLWPNGVAFSPYAARLGALLIASAVAAAAFARSCTAANRGWAFAALLSACLVQGVAGTSPVMVVSDAVFHANTLARVAGGDLFPVSVTQHDPPFRIPYGVSFYALLAPFARAGLDGVALVRWGAALAGVAASAALFALLAPRSGAAAAGLAVAVLQLMPAVFDVGFSFGNFSNAFGQAMTVVFFGWWTSRDRAAPAAAGLAGGALLALAMLAHLSSLIVGAAVALALALAERRAGGMGRARTLALAIGLGAAAVYYGLQASLVTSQLHRLAEGGRGGGGALAALSAQLIAVIGLGLPAVALAAFGHPWRRDRPPSPLDRALAAYAVAAAALAVPAVVSPLEVRYLYALSLPVAAAAGLGLVRLLARGGGWRMTGFILAAAMVARGAANLADAVFFRYRP